MRVFSVFILTISLLVLSAETVVQAGEGAVYSRNREGSRKGYAGGHYGGNYGGYGFFGYQPAVAGHWYARPYPYHFDYYRYRWNTPAPQQINDCPCAATTLEQ